MHISHPPVQAQPTATPMTTPTPPPGVRFPATWVVETNRFTGSATLKIPHGVTVNDSFSFTGEFHFDGLQQPQAIFDGRYDGKSKAIFFKRLTPDNRTSRVRRLSGRK